MRAPSLCLLPAFYLAFVSVLPVPARAVLASRAVKNRLNFWR
jgi:hypothetical protein